MVHKHFTSIKLDMTDEELQQWLLQGQITALAEQAQGPQWATKQSLDLIDEGPKQVTITFSRSWTTQEGLEDLGKPKP